MLGIKIVGSELGGFQTFTDRAATNTKRSEYTLFDFNIHLIQMPFSPRRKYKKTARTKSRFSQQPSERAG